MPGYITTAEIQDKRSDLSTQERQHKEKLLEAELAKFGVNRNNFDRAYEELKTECHSRLRRKPERRSAHG